jgi:hypothetical protein
MLLPRRLLWGLSRPLPVRLLSTSPPPQPKPPPPPSLDLRCPHAWYPAARALRRRVVFHAGPTNSGKTHAALEALRAAPSGVYAGPLRLLAWEVHERLLDGGLACDLVTGQERVAVEGAAHVSATVEMVDTDAGVAVAVVDEIQMLGDEARGWAWARALLGLPADEIHVCGDPAAVPLVRRLLARTGDELDVRTYARLSPLVAAPDPVNSLADVKAGDCVVSFGRTHLYRLKMQIERSTGLRVGLIYGALPPAVRKEQARAFNAGAGGGAGAGAGAGAEAAPPGGGALRTDVLVASDAIGMGLNLSIQRVIFSRLQKFDGKRVRRLSVSEVKQIGGRAGRFGGVFPVGTVAVLAQQQGSGAAGGQGPGGQTKGGAAGGAPVAGATGEAAVRLGIRHVAECLASPTPHLRVAGLLPTLGHLEEFAASLAPAWMREQYGLPPVDDEEEEDDNDDNEREEEDITHHHHNNTTSDAASPFPVDSSHLGPSSPSAEGPVASLADAVLSHVPYSSVLRLYAQSAVLDTSCYALCDVEPAARVAALIDSVPDIHFRARHTFCLAPVDSEDPIVASALRRYARQYSRGARVRHGVVLPAAAPATAEDLAVLESIHSALDLYLWLARRFPADFTAPDQAAEAADRAQRLISEGIAAMGEEHVRAGLRQRLRALQSALRRTSSPHVDDEEGERGRGSADGEMRRRQQRQPQRQQQQQVRERRHVANPRSGKAAQRRAAESDELEQLRALEREWTSRVQWEEEEGEEGEGDAGAAARKTEEGAPPPPPSDRAADRKRRRERLRREEEEAARAISDLRSTMRDARSPEATIARGGEDESPPPPRATSSPRPRPTKAQVRRALRQAEAEAFMRAMSGDLEGLAGLRGLRGGGGGGGGGGKGGDDLREQQHKQKPRQQKHRRAKR